MITNRGPEQVYQGVSTGIFTAFRSKSSPTPGSCAIDCRNHSECLSFKFSDRVCYLGGKLVGGDVVLSSVFLVTTATDNVN